jgi:hypothetical protein
MLASSAVNPMATTSIENCFLSEILIIAAFFDLACLDATIAGAMSLLPNAFTPSR